jgi:hypothetical protein
VAAPTKEAGAVITSTASLVAHTETWLYQQLGLGHTPFLAKARQTWRAVAGMVLLLLLLLGAKRRVTWSALLAEVAAPVREAGAEKESTARLVACWDVPAMARCGDGERECERDGERDGERNVDAGASVTLVFLSLGFLGAIVGADVGSCGVL